MAAAVDARRGRAPTAARGDAALAAGDGAPQVPAGNRPSTLRPSAQRPPAAQGLLALIPHPLPSIPCRVLAAFSLSLGSAPTPHPR